MAAGEGDEELAQAGAARRYCYAYPRPAVTVDLAVFALFGSDLRVLLVRRKHEPFAGCWAFPGGFLEIDEPIEAAARRELREETGFDVSSPVELIGVFGDPGRDPRGRTISLVHAAAVRHATAAVAGADDAAEAAWRDPGCPGHLAFDHDAILAVAVAWLAKGVAEGDLGLALLPVTFAAGEVRGLFKALGMPATSAAAWIKRLRRAGRIRPSGGRYQSAGVAT
jgi:8-oxo-dGTP diphosphatase